MHVDDILGRVETNLFERQPQTLRKVVISIVSWRVVRMVVSINVEHDSFSRKC